MSGYKSLSIMRNGRGNSKSHSNKAEDVIKISTEKLNRTYSFPARMEDAKIHVLATSFGFNSPLTKDGNSAPVCPCC